METIILKDANTNLTYQLHVDKETAEKCRNDIVFATNVLQKFTEPHTSNDIYSQEYEDSTPNTAVSNSNNTVPEWSRAETLANDTYTQEYESVESNAAVSNSANTARDWSRAETIALIQAYETNKENFSHARKRKTVWHDIHTILESEGIYKTVKAIETKWKNLVRTYKNVKDASNKTGRGSTRFQYMDEMDEVMGNRPLMNNEHSVGVGITPLSRSSCNNTENNNEKECPALEFRDDCVEPSRETSSTRKKSSNSTIFTLKRNYLKNKIDEIKMKQEERQEYYNFLKEEKLLKRQREQRKLQLKEREIEIEERKLELLETYLKSKTSDLD